MSDDGRLASLEKTIKDLTKKFGDGTIVRLGEASHLAVDIIPTGALSLDIAVGVGGIPRGRVTEIYGPESSGKTTLCLHIISQAQRRGGICSFIDMEHALDATYAENIGVNVNDLYISQPDTGEQALEIAEALVRSGSMDVIVLDSVAALVPRAEIEGEMGDSHVGLQARLMSQALRKLSGAIKQSNTAMIFTNQLREKIGVMFGCFHYDTRVTLANGSSEKIGKIVNQKLDVKVLSYRHETDKFEPRKIVNWFDNGPTGTFLQFIVDSNRGNGRHAFACTPNHLLLTEKGYRRAGSLKVGDRLITSVPHYLSPTHKAILFGSVLGDGSMRRASDFNTQLRIGHGESQIEYSQWKQPLFDGMVKYQATNSKNGHSFDTIPMYELTQIVDENYAQGVKNLNTQNIHRLTPLAVAIWYMDDGTLDSERQNRCSICAVGLPAETRLAAAQWFNEQGIAVKVDSRGRINFGVEATHKFHEMIAPYMHPSMEFKLIPDQRGKFVPLTPEADFRNEAVAMPILDIYEKPQSRATHRFDLEIEGNHSYVVDGVVVHNSPETTTGGRALKFYATIRLDIRKIEGIKQGGEVVGSRTRVRVTKNKVAAPFKEAEFDIMYGSGISYVGDLLDLADLLGLVEKKGAFYRYNEELIGQGRENAKQFLAEHLEYCRVLDQGIREAYGLRPLPTPPEPEK